MLLPLEHFLFHNTPLHRSQLRIRIILLRMARRTDDQTATRSERYPNSDILPSYQSDNTDDGVEGMVTKLTP
jgi:hypothetical protein